MQSPNIVLESQRTDSAGTDRGLFGDAPPDPWYPTTASGAADDGQDHAADADPELPPP